MIIGLQYFLDIKDGLVPRLKTEGRASAFLDRLADTRKIYNTRKTEHPTTDKKR
jgi:hypothetical protein